MKNKTILIDSASIAYAAFHTMGHLSYNSMKTGVIYGFFKRLLAMAVKFNSTDFIFCWDDKTTHRHINYPGYKQKRIDNREREMEEDPQKKEAWLSMQTQMLLLQRKLLPKMGFRNNFLIKLYEADDLLAYWINKLRNKKQLIMVTSDADMYQCLDDCKIWCPLKKKYFTRKDLINEFGIKPNKWAMAKAIGGCSGDNVIGIDGVADPKNKTSKALKYLREELPEGKIKKRIESKEGQAIIKKNLPIVTVPYQEHLMSKMIKRRNKFNRRNFIEVFDALHMKSLLKEEEFSKWEKIFLGGGKHNGRF